MNQRRKFIDGRSFLFGLGGLATFGVVATSKATYENQQIQALDDPKKDFTVNHELKLKQLAAQKGLIYGTESRKDILSSDALYAAAIVKNCSMLVPEWEFKWTAGKQSRP